MKERNVIRTMQLLAAAQQAPQLERTIVKSTTAVYGSSYADPALLREDTAPSATGGSGYAKDAVEIESYSRAFARRRPDMTLTVLRFANFIGGGAGSLIARYLGLPVVPTVLGFDPRVQLCHTFDAVEVLHRAVTEDHPGIYNVAGPGVVYLSQLVRLAGKPTVAVPRPLVGPVAGLVRRTGAVDFSPEQVQFLLYGRVGDISRLRTHFGYEPRYRTRAAIEEFLREDRTQPLLLGATLERAEQLLGALGRPRGARRRST
jgi:UDP-glucose 4-epimerase